MSQFAHNQEAFLGRMSARQANPVLPDPFITFYHVACMGNWQEVVNEQFSLLSFVGLTHVAGCVLGTLDQANQVKQKAKRWGIDFNILYVNVDLGEFEHPTICALYRWAKENPTGAVLYIHTKGVSVPNDRYKPTWRRIMQKYLVVDWRTNLQHLQCADMCGVSWQELKDFPHFCGNFWMARCDWLTHLRHPHVYREQEIVKVWAHHPWRRMHCELWLGSEPYHHVMSLLGKNMCFWAGEQAFQIPIDIEGFTYQ